jgi:hypothetical protein
MSKMHDPFRYIDANKFLLILLKGSSGSDESKVDIFFTIFLFSPPSEQEQTTLGYLCSFLNFCFKKILL